MIYNFKYSESYDRAEVCEYLSQKKFTRVIDLGACAASWSSPFITHYADVMQHENSSLISFLGSICSYDIWNKILDDVDKNGKYDFAICTHTLEDISSPGLVCEMLPKIAKEGYIAVPSKFIEMRKHEGPYFGWIHHRWLFNKEGNDFVAYPKLPFVEYTDTASRIFRGRDIERSVDLSFFWSDSFEMKIANNDYMGPDVPSVVRYFGGLTED
jgi:hypothetical protein